VTPKKRIAIIPGDGIGPEVISEAIKVIQASRAPVEQPSSIGAPPATWPTVSLFRPTASRCWPATLTRSCWGPSATARVPTNIHAKEILLGMRFTMDLYANLRPVRLLDASLCPLKAIEPKDIDFVVVRENTEGAYVDAGGVFKRGTPDEIAVQEDINTRKGWSA